MDPDSESSEDSIGPQWLSINGKEDEYCLEDRMAPVSGLIAPEE